LSLGSLSAPLPIILLVGLVAGLAGATFQIHHVLVRMFSLTFLGMDDPFSFEDIERRNVDDDTYVYTDDGAEPYEIQDLDADPASAQERSRD
ncbi:MAG: hypothetical protein VX947_02510, partial [Chloroflexota bacterium]|nr:hypothetical protein [Chloroflexota bacterium]